MTTTTAKRTKKRASGLSKKREDELLEHHPERLVECPECGAKVGKACRGQRASHEARVAVLGLDRTCEECRAAPGRACSARGLWLRPGVTHVSRRRAQRDLGDALERPPPPAELAHPCPTCGARPGGDCKTASGRRLKAGKDGRPGTHAARRTIPLNAEACLECQHPECPIVPDCSACPTCRAAAGAEDGDVWLERHQERLERRLASDMGTPVLDYLALSDVREDGGTQTRARIHDEVVVEYADAYRADAELPAPIVFFDGEAYWLADGFHRCRAMRSEGISHATFEVRQGTRRDAILHSVGANAHHGLRRTNADKRRAVETLLRDEEWTSRSNRWIAEKCAVSDPFVGAVRREVQTVSTSHRVGQDGKAYPSSSSRSDSSTSSGESPARPVDDVVGRTETGEDSLRWSCQWCDAQPWEPCRGETGAELPGVHRGRGAPAPEGCGLCYDEGAPEGCAACGREGNEDEDDGSAPDPSDAEVDPSGIEVIPQGSTERPLSWREVLEIPPGPVDGTTVLEHYDRLHEAASAGDPRAVAMAESGELDRAKARALSQWHTREREADLLVELSGLAELGERPRILEPSGGAGALIKAARGACPKAHITAHEIDPVSCGALRNPGAADVVHRGDFLASEVPSPLFDLALMNPPYENGLDGRFLEHAMACSLRLAALVRLNALTGQDRCRRVWAQVKAGEWHLAKLVPLETRPGFDGPGDDGARSDHVLVVLQRAELASADRRTVVDWR